MKNLLSLVCLFVYSISLTAQDDLYGIDGRIFYIENAANGKYLDSNTKALGKNGRNVIVYPADSDDGKKWKFEYVRKGKLGGLYLIINQQKELGKYKYLQVNSHEVGTNNGKIQLWEKHNEERQKVYGDNQLWQVYKNSDGTFSITSAHTKSGGAYAMEVPKKDLTLNVSEVQIYWNRGYKHQQWYIKSILK